MAFGHDAPTGCPECPAGTDAVEIEDGRLTCTECDWSNPCGGSNQGP